MKSITIAAICLALFSTLALCGTQIPKFLEDGKTYTIVLLGDPIFYEYTILGKAQGDWYYVDRHIDATSTKRLWINIGNATTIEEPSTQTILIRPSRQPN